MPEPIAHGSTPAGAPRRRSRGSAVFLAALILLPVIEIAVAIQVGQLIGSGWTVLLIVVGCAAGALVIRREGMAAFRALDDSLRTGRQPARRRAPADSALVLLGGLLLLTPGFVTDVLGLVLLLPVTRPLARRLFATWIGRSLERAVLVGGGRFRPRGPEVVQGEVVDVEVLEVRDLPPAAEPPSWGSPPEGEDDDRGRPPRR